MKKNWQLCGKLFWQNYNKAYCPLAGWQNDKGFFTFPFIQFMMVKVTAWLPKQFLQDNKKTHTFLILQISYLIFMCMYNYIVLVKLERHHPSVMEGYVMAYIFLHGLEMIREVGILLLQLTSSNSTKNKILQVLLSLSKSLFSYYPKNKEPYCFEVGFHCKAFAYLSYQNNSSVFLFCLQHNGILGCKASQAGMNH